MSVIFQKERKSTKFLIIALKSTCFVKLFILIVWKERWGSGYKLYDQKETYLIFFLNLYY